MAKFWTKIMKIQKLIKHLHFMYLVWKFSDTSQATLVLHVFLLFLSSSLLVLLLLSVLCSLV